MNIKASTKRTTRRAAAGVLTAGVLAVGLLIAPQAANANGYGETWSDGLAGRTMVNVVGTGTTVDWVDAGHTHSAEPWLNYCGRQTKTWGTKSSGATATAYSFYTSGCTPFAFWGATGLSGTFKNNSYVYSQARHDGAWRAGKPRVHVYR
jgi:hypothetical protein